jgi:pimeloyl-ACP methyl ester carboxylesterase
MRSLQTPERVERVAVGDDRGVLVRRRDGTGIPVVLLHGLLDSSAGWSGLCRAITGPTVAVDLAGFGDSSAATAPELGAFADDVVRALRRLRLARFVLVGHSLGGAVASVVAERMPDQVAGLVLLAPAGFGRIPLADAVSLPIVRSVVDRLLPHALARPRIVSAMYRAGITGGPPPDAALLETLAADPVRLAVSARRAVAAIVASDSLHERGVAYGGPVHVVWGDRDRVVPPAHLGGVEDAFPHVFGELWRGMGHHHQREAPGRLARLIERVRDAAVVPSLERLAA